MSTLAGLLRHPALALAFRLYLGGLFISAAMYKINYPAEFTTTIASYRMAPWWSVNILALFMPWLELVSGVLLVAGFRVKAAVSVIAGLIVLFTIGIVVNLLRGAAISCGCFHTIDAPISWWTVARDLTWLGMAAHVYFFDRYLQIDRALVRDLKEIGT